MKRIETLAEYQQLAARTCPDLGSDKLNIYHMNSGIITEIGEAIDPIKKHIAYGKPLDMVNIAEEIFDAAWYIANRSRMFLSVEQNTFFWATNAQLEEGINAFNEEFKDKSTTYESEFDKLIDASNLIDSSKPFGDLEVKNSQEFLGIPSIVLLYKACDILGIDFWQGLTNNIAKLQSRYPDKFTTEAALNRNLVAERETLERVNEGIVSSKEEADQTAQIYKPDAN